MGKCKTGLKRRTSSLHVQHLGLNQPDTGQAVCGHLLRLFDAACFQHGFDTMSRLLVDGSKASENRTDLPQGQSSCVFKGGGFYLLLSGAD